ncbi:cation transporting ATPase C-terminal domain-containing protein [Nonomuraea sp. bgisy101]|uniref:cation transporting ATPase C-terminal domain-containing protein n=1 Tax=Nonomuraea sp. bgisy101 TaxID=3413784 RepID=UPI003D722D1F
MTRVSTTRPGLSAGEAAERLAVEGPNVLPKASHTSAAVLLSRLLATASGTAFAAVVLGQFANAWACRSESRRIGRIGLLGNPLLIAAVAFEVGVLLLFLGLAPLAGLLGGSFPTPAGWALASLAIPAVILADTTHKTWRHRHERHRGI